LVGAYALAAVCEPLLAGRASGWFTDAITELDVPDEVRTTILNDALEIASVDVPSVLSWIRVFLRFTDARAAGTVPDHDVASNR